MNFTKKAFTLAELLLVISIIGIVTAMGMSIAKKTTENAYKKFFYTGYTNLYNAVFDIESSNKPHSTVTSFQKSIDEIFKENKNGITYEVVKKFGIQPTYYTIDMTVPYPKTRTNPDGKLSTRFFYTTDNGSNFLIPIAGPAGYVNLQDRADLLKAYVDNGLTGRIVGNKFGGNNGEKVIKQSFRQSYCSCNDSYTVSGINESDLYAWSPLKLYNEIAFTFKHVYALKQSEHAEENCIRNGPSGWCGETEYHGKCRDNSTWDGAKCECNVGYKEDGYGHCIPDDMIIPDKIGDGDGEEEEDDDDEGDTFPLQSSGNITLIDCTGITKNKIGAIKFIQH